MKPFATTNKSACPSMSSLYYNWMDNLKEDGLKTQRLERMASSKDISFYFRKGDHFYGGPEESRMSFARMKQPADNEKDWAKDATFVAIDLGDAAKGEVKETLFGPKDLKDIKVVDKDDAYGKVAG